MEETKERPSKVRRAIAVAVAGATLGVMGAFTVAAAQGEPTTACAPTEADLLRAAESARQLQIERPDLFEGSSRPADYYDLRLAAEWARRMEALHPVEGC